MAAHHVMATVKVALMLAIIALIACSPEATRTRDGGPGADIGNKDVVQQTYAAPHAADTTMMPGRAPAPVARFERAKQ